MKTFVIMLILLLLTSCNSLSTSKQKAQLLSEYGITLNEYDDAEYIYNHEFQSIKRVLGNSISDIKDNLKNPNSLQINSVRLVGENLWLSVNSYLIFDISAQNGFGGMAREKWMYNESGFVRKNPTAYDLRSYTTYNLQLNWQKILND